MVPARPAGDCARLVRVEGAAVGPLVQVARVAGQAGAARLLHGVLAAVGAAVVGVRVRGGAVAMDACKNKGKGIVVFVSAKKIHKELTLQLMKVSDEISLNGS